LWDVVAEKAADLAKAAQIPLGSLHFGSAIAGEETAYQDRARRLRTSGHRLSGLVSDF